MFHRISYFICLFPELINQITLCSLLRSGFLFECCTTQSGRKCSPEARGDFLSDELVVMTKQTTTPSLLIIIIIIIYFIKRFSGHPKSLYSPESRSHTQSPGGAPSGATAALGPTDGSVAANRRLRPLPQSAPPAPPPPPTLIHIHTTRGEAAVHVFMILFFFNTVMECSGY